MGYSVTKYNRQRGKIKAKKFDSDIDVREEDELRRLTFRKRRQRSVEVIRKRRDWVAQPRCRRDGPIHSHELSRVTQQVACVQALDC